MNIHSYGVFISGGIPYLHQGEEGRDALGQNNLSPLKLELYARLKRLGAPHSIDLQPPAIGWQLSNEFLNNQLVDFFLPKPNLNGLAPQRVFIKNKSMEPFPILKKLSQLCSLNQMATQLYNDVSEHVYQNELKLTNLGPLSLISAGVNDSGMVFELFEYAHFCHRNLVIAGHEFIPTPQGVRDLTDSYNHAVELLAEMPKDINLQLLGAHFFKHWMAHIYNQNHGSEFTDMYT